jgi:hypothetical protein
VFTPAQFGEFKDAAEATSNGKKATAANELDDYYLDWRTYQFSDHRPLWVRLQVNDSEKYLKSLLGN